MFRFATMALIALTSSVEAVYENSKIAGLARMTDMVLDGLKATTARDNLADEIISAMDTSGDNQISLKELMGFVQKICSEFDYQLTQDDKDVIKAEFIKIDKDGSDKVDKKELEEYIEQNPQIRNMFS